MGGSFGLFALGFLAGCVFTLIAAVCGLVALYRVVLRV
jgi:hypothetical protein